MKKYRPYKAGFIVLYVLVLMCVGDAVYTLISSLLGTANSYITSIAWFSYLIAILGILYISMYAATKVEIDDKTMHLVYPVYIRPQPGAKRAMFIFRQGDTDIKKVDKRFQLADLARYGYIEDLKYAQLDQSNAGPNNKLFPVHEIALVMNDGKRYHMNAGFYSAKQLTGMVEQIHAATGLLPEGKLANLVPQLKNK